VGGHLGQLLLQRVQQHVQQRLGCLLLGAAVAAAAGERRGAAVEDARQLLERGVRQRGGQGRLRPRLLLLHRQRCQL
jgi:hypothetical protein